MKYVMSLKRRERMNVQVQDSLYRDCEGYAFEMTTTRTGKEQLSDGGQGRGGRSGRSHVQRGRAELAYANSDRQDLTERGSAGVESRQRSGRGERGVWVARGMGSRCEQDGPVQGRGGASGSGAFHGSGWARSRLGKKPASRWWATERTLLPQPARAETPLESAPQRTAASHTSRLK